LESEQIAEGKERLREAMSSPPVGAYTVQAAVAAVHADATDANATDWTQIIHLYDVLREINPSPVVELNWAVAVSMKNGPSEGLACVEAILSRGELQDYFLAHAARAFAVLVLAVVLAVVWILVRYIKRRRRARRVRTELQG